MRKLISFTLSIFYTSLVVAQPKINCPTDGKQDATACLQSCIESSSLLGHSVILNLGTYRITSSLIIPSNIKIVGKNTSLFLDSKISNTKLLMINGESNIDISGINFIANGSFSESVYSNKFTNLKSSSGIGFTNGFSAVFISGCAKNISVTNNKFFGFDFGINHQTNCPQNARNLNYSHNNFSNLGQSAIFIINGSNIQIKNNKIDSVSGNIVVNNAPSLSDAKFADGIFISGVRDVVIESNNINNIKRICIVVERVYDKNLNQNVINDNITISNNHITNANGSRGTECNAGIWVEPFATKNNPNYYRTNHVVINGNYIDNIGAESGAHIQYGIFSGGLNTIIINNQIKNFTNVSNDIFLNVQKNDLNSSGAIYCVYGHQVIKNNTMFNTNIGILKNPSAYLSSYQIESNVFIKVTKQYDPI